MTLYWLSGVFVFALLIGQVSIQSCELSKHLVIFCIDLFRDRNERGVGTIILGGVTPLNLRGRFNLDSAVVLHASPAGLTNLCKILS